MIRQTMMVACLGATLAVGQDDGQGAVEAGPIQVADLNIGKHWFGPAIDKQDLLGKVVLVEIWGS